MNSQADLTVLELGTHRIRYDGRYNWILAEVVMRERKKGENVGEQYEGEDSLRYYNDIEEAADHLFRERIGRLGKHNSVAELIKAIRECRAELQDAIVSEIKRGYSKKNGS